MGTFVIRARPKAVDYVIEADNKKQALLLFKETWQGQDAKVVKVMEAKDA